MAVHIAVVAALCALASAAPPAPHRLYTHSSAQIQQTNPLDYYLDNADVAYYNQGQQKQDADSESSGAPSRLETLDPDSEVELIPGAQAPQQPPQQTPVAPNVPGILPGQRVFIVHMPVPGYRPGTIGGYQPVYIVAAAPDGNVYTPNGYQAPVGQNVYSPFLGYPRPDLVAQGSPGFVVGGAPITLNRPYNLVYQEPVVAYHSVASGQAGQSSGESVSLAQTVTLQRQPAQLASDARPANEAQTDPELKRAKLESSPAKEGEEPRRNARPAPPHANRTKA